MLCQSTEGWEIRARCVCVCVYAWTRFLVNPNNSPWKNSSSRWTEFCTTIYLLFNCSSDNTSVMSLLNFLQLNIRWTVYKIHLFVELFSRFFILCLSFAFFSLKRFHLSCLLPQQRRHINNWLFRQIIQFNFGCS